MDTTMAQPKAGFLIRAIAYIVDAIALGIIGSILSGVLSGGNATGTYGFSTLLGLVYFAYFWSVSGGGQTLGMRLFKLKVVKTDGSLLDIGGAVVRYIGLVVSFVVIFIGVIWVAFDPNKQGWHDKIAGTYVVKTA